jgi:hypothetical protein
MIKDWQQYKSYAFITAYLLGAEESILETFYSEEYLKSNGLAKFLSVPNALLLRSLSRVRQYYLHNLDTYLTAATLGDSVSRLSKEFSILKEYGGDLEETMNSRGQLSDVINLLTTEINQLVKPVLISLNFPRVEVMDAVFYMAKLSNRDLSKLNKLVIQKNLSVYPFDLIIIRGERLGKYLTGMLRNDHNLLLGNNNITAAGTLPSTLMYPEFSWDRVALQPITTSTSPLSPDVDKPKIVENEPLTEEKDFGSSIGDYVNSDALKELYKKAYGDPNTQLAPEEELSSAPSTINSAVVRKGSSDKESKKVIPVVRTNTASTVVKEVNPVQEDKVGQSVQHTRAVVSIPTDSRRIEPPVKNPIRGNYTWSLYVDCNNVDVFMLLGALNTMSGYSEDQNSSYRIKLFADEKSSPLWGILDQLLTDKFTIERYPVEHILGDKCVTDMVMVTHMTKDYVEGSKSMGILSSSSGFFGVMQSWKDVDFFVGYSDATISENYLAHLLKEGTTRFCVRDELKQIIAKKNKTVLLTALCLQYISQNPPAQWLANTVTDFMYTTFNSTLNGIEMFPRSVILSKVQEVIEDLKVVTSPEVVKLSSLGTEIVIGS